MNTTLTWADVGITVSGTGPEVATTCPQCAPTRKKKNLKCMSVNTEKGVWICHHCDWRGSLKQGEEYKGKKLWTKPTPPQGLVPTNEFMQFVNDRGLSLGLMAEEGVQLVMAYMPQVEETVPCIAFPYVKNGEPVNYKFRGLHEKHFRQIGGAEKIFYRQPKIDKKRTYVFEGEFDALCAVAAGIDAAISVPDGAPAVKAKNYSAKFTYLNQDPDPFEEVKEIVLAVDNDEPGLKLRDELSRRLGRDRCWFVTWPDGCKDANNVLRIHGVDRLRECLTQAQPFPVAEPASRLIFRRVSDIEAKPIRWLWPGRIARGKVSMIAGNPGLGKSQVTASVTAIVSIGGTWPVDKTACEVGNTIILSAEDDPADTIRPRLEVAGANLSRVYILDAIIEGADGSEVRRGFDLESDLSRLGAMLEKIGGATLVVIDPITCYLGTTDSHKNSDIRALLSPLSEFAAKYETAVVCVNHFNKNSGGEAITRVTGSLAFVAAARAVFVVARDPEKGSRRLFLPLKNNLGNDQTGLAFTVESAQLGSPHGPIHTSHVLWETGTVTTTAEEAMAPQSSDEDRTELDEAKNFLQALLAKGPVSSKQIQADVKGAGHSWRTIQRAQQTLGIVAYKKGMKEGWAWRLPGPIPTEEGQTSPNSPTPKTWHSSHSSGEVGGLQEGQVQTSHAEECQIHSEDCQESPKNTKDAKIFDEAPSGGLAQDKGELISGTPPKLVDAGGPLHPHRNDAPPHELEEGVSGGSDTPKATGEPELVVDL
jgi:putative DNA primase/helicase